MKTKNRKNIESNDRKKAQRRARRKKRPEERKKQIRIAISEEERKRRQEQRERDRAESIRRDQESINRRLAEYRSRAFQYARQHDPLSYYAPKPPIVFSQWDSDSAVFSQGL